MARSTRVTLSLNRFLSVSWKLSILMTVLSSSLPILLLRKKKKKNGNRNSEEQRTEGLKLITKIGPRNESRYPFEERISVAIWSVNKMINMKSAKLSGLDRVPWEPEHLVSGTKEKERKKIWVFFFLFHVKVFGRPAEYKETGKQSPNEVHCLALAYLWKKRNARGKKFPISPSASSVLLSLSGINPMGRKVLENRFLPE